MFFLLSISSPKHQTITIPLHHQRPIHHTQPHRNPPPTHFPTHWTPRPSPTLNYPSSLNFTTISLQLDDMLEALKRGSQTLMRFAKGWANLRIGYTTTTPRTSVHG